jgi:hypothetical protein
MKPFETFNVHNHETGETVSFDNIKDLIEFMNEVDDVFSFEIKREKIVDTQQ